MKSHRFGKTSLQVSEIGFGCARLGGFFQTASRDEALRALGAAYDAGVTFYDTSDLYTQGESESLVGAACRPYRDRVVIATKVGYLVPTRRKAAVPFKAAIKKVVNRLGIKRQHLPGSFSGKLSQDFSPEYIRQAVEISLRRLQTDYIDLYQLHSPPEECLASGDFVAVLEDLKSQGKIRFYGISCEDYRHVELSLKSLGISSVQVGMGLLDQEPLEGVVPLAATADVAVIARGCYGGGLLRPDLSEDALKAMTPKWPAILALRRLAAENGRDVLDVALQYVRNVPGVSVTLLGMRTPEQVAANLRCLAAQPLTADEISAIQRLPYPVEA